MTVRFDSLDPARGPRSFLFLGPRRTVTARFLDEVEPALEQVEREVADGFHAAGFVAYEAGPAFDSALTVKDPDPALPLLCFGIFERRAEIEPLSRLPPGPGGYTLDPPAASLTPADYKERVSRILDLIAAGDSYQVNLTFRLSGAFSGSPLALYRDLVTAQRSAFCAYLPIGGRTIVSASPELFFRCAGRDIELRPMKGTRPRGRWPEEDDELARSLAASPKDRAENLMIVDLLRNDLGRVAEFGSVRVPTLFEVERYPTVHQLTSTITGRLREDAGLLSLFRALFPSGSVTGAPKIRTSGIIGELEDSPRGPYTGAIGFVGPGESTFSVAIRTLVTDPGAGRYELGVGSGITADSQADAEYRECLEKGAFLTHRPPEFELLESLRLEVPGGYSQLADHLERLRRSARYFGFPFAAAAAERMLEEAAEGMESGVYKVRLLVSREGDLRVESEAIPRHSGPVRLRLAAEPVDERDPFLYHKTTNRAIHRRAAAGSADTDDVILYNRRGELTETTTANLVLELDGALVTPPLECGLLAGVLRARLLAEGRIEPRVLSTDDLRCASAIHLVSSVRGWRRGVLLDAGLP